MSWLVIVFEPKMPNTADARLTVLDDLFCVVLRGKNPTGMPLEAIVIFRTVWVGPFDSPKNGSRVGYIVGVAPTRRKYICYSEQLCLLFTHGKPSYNQLATT